MNVLDSLLYQEPGFHGVQSVMEMERFCPFEFSSTAVVGAKTSVWADEIKRDFTFGLAFFSVTGTPVLK